MRRVPSRSTISRAVGVIVLLVLVAPGSGVGAVAEPLGHSGRWITDAKGRVVVLHGFNTVPVNEDTLPREMGMGPDNARWLAAHGFNTIRLGLYYARVEPRPGDYDRGYLRDYLRVQRELADRGIFTLLGMHQDQLNPRFGTGGVLPSRGFPDWMIRDDGLPNTRTPYPGGYLANPALNRAYDNLWRGFDAPDRVSIHDHFAEGWRRIAHAFESRPGLLGYDFFNEPWPGIVWATCASPLGCLPGGFDQTLLTAFNRKLTTAIRAEDPDHLIFYEPNLLFDYGAQTQVGDVGDAGAGFSFHNYCLAYAVPGGFDSVELCGVNEELVFDNADAHADRSGDALLLTELPFGTPSVRRQVELADRHMVSWQNWDYYGDIAHEPGVRPWNLLIRPYPQLIAGTPIGWSFDRRSRLFELSYSTQRPDGQVFDGHPLTQVELPPLHYPRGYTAEVSGARVVSAPDADPLLLRAESGASAVEVAVSPARHHPPVRDTGRCLQRLGAIPLPRGSVTRAKVWVNRQRLQGVSSRDSERLRLPPGLTNGSGVRVVTTGSRGRKLVTRGRIRDCRLRLR